MKRIAIVIVLFHCMRQSLPAEQDQFALNKLNAISCHVEREDGLTYILFPTISSGWGRSVTAFHYSLLSRVDNVHSIMFTDGQLFRKEKDLAFVGNLKMLVQIGVWIADDAELGVMRPISESKSLRSLRIADMEFHKPEIVRLSDMPQLQSLKLITLAEYSAVCPVVSKMNSCRSIVLSCGGTMGDGDLIHFLGCSNLRTLSVTRARFSLTAFEDFQRRMPNCEFRWWGP